MANSKLPPKNNTELINRVAQSLACAFKTSKNPKLLLALSGGLDSTVLLHLLVQCQQLASFQLSAMHVHHGLSPNADAWADFCMATCQQLNVPCDVVHVHVDQSLGLGTEAAARAVRYQALQSADADWICLAHHKNDQAETLLLQLARGAGVKGLSGMGEMDAKKQLLRPLLDIPRVALEAYAKTHQLNWVEDESNQSLDFDRNMMRHKILPLLTQQYPAIIANLSRSAQHQAEASELLDDLATMDAVTVLQVQERTHAKLALPAFRQLSEPRAKNVLRYWLASADVKMPNAAHLAELFKQLQDAKQDASTQVKVSESLFVRTYKAWAYLVPELPEVNGFEVVWRDEAVVSITDHVTLLFEKAIGVGLSLEKLKDKKLTIKSRIGGERLRLGSNQPTKTVKQLLQQASIPPWERSNYPLVYVDDELVAIVGLAPSSSFQVSQQALGLNITLSNTTL